MLHQLLLQLPWFDICLSYTVQFRSHLTSLLQQASITPVCVPTENAASAALTSVRHHQQSHHISLCVCLICRQRKPRLLKLSPPPHPPPPQQLSLSKKAKVPRPNPHQQRQVQAKKGLMLSQQQQQQQQVGVSLMQQLQRQSLPMLARLMAQLHPRHHFPSRLVLGVPMRLLYQRHLMFENELFMSSEEDSMPTCMQSLL